MDSRLFKEAIAPDRVQRMRQKIAGLELQIQRDLEKEQGQDEEKECGKSDS